MIKVTKCVQTCDSCPAQFEGATDDGRFVFAHYRYEYFSCDVGATVDAAVEATLGRPMFGEEHEEFNMSYDDLKRWTAGKIEWPEEFTQSWRLGS